VWRDVHKGDPTESLGRVSDFALFVLSRGGYLVCGDVAIESPSPLPRAPENLTLRVRVEPVDAIPRGNYTVLVDWEVGCACVPVPRGNTSAPFTVP